MTYDLLIRHGTVIDGTGAPGVMTDVGVSGGHITALGPHLGGRAGREIDASGRVVAPGFIDVHTHSDFTLLSAPSADSQVRQGITTEVVGNCGFSPAPVRPQTLELLKEYTGLLNPHLPWDWQRLGEFYQRVSARGCAMNIAPLVGHGAVRIAVMGFDNWEVLTTNARPELTSIDANLKHLGRTAAQRVFAALDAAELGAGTEYIEGRLVIRGSTVPRR